MSKFKKYDYIQANDFMSPMTLIDVANWYYHTGGVRQLKNDELSFAVFGLRAGSSCSKLWSGPSSKSLCIPFVYSKLRVRLFTSNESEYAKT